MSNMPWTSIRLSSFSPGNDDDLHLMAELTLFKELSKQCINVYLTSPIPVDLRDQTVREDVQNAFENQWKGKSEMEITILENDKLLNPTIKISLCLSDARKKKKCNYIAWIVSLTRLKSGSKRSKLRQDFKLPLMCVTSSKPVIGMVHPVLQAVLGVSLLPYCPQFFECKWIIGILLNEIRRKSLDGDLSLKYEVHNGMTMTVHLNHDGCEYVCDRNQLSGNEELTSGAVKETFNEIEAHYETRFGVSVGYFKIASVSIDDIEMSFDKQFVINRCPYPEVLFALLLFVETTLMEVDSTHSVVQFY